MTQNLDKHDCKEELKDVDLKVTPGRLGVLAALEQADMPLDVATMVDYLKDNHVKADKVTIFRIINTLTDKGLVTPIQLGEGKFRYELSNKADHHHFICENCKTITDISDCNISVLEKAIKLKKGFIIKRHSLEFFGLCKNCQK